MTINDLIQQRFDTNLLRFLAVIAVVNSHLDFLYPTGYGYFATGGAIGNSLFFFSSGFGLWFGLQFLTKSSFIQWFSKRCSRVYPPYLILLPFLIVTLFHTGDMNLSRVINIGEIIFFPHQAYWFLQAMILFYIVIFMVFSISPDKIKTLNLTMLLSVCLYLVSYFFIIDLTVFSIESLPFKLIFYFICILLGMYLAKKGNKPLFNIMMSSICVTFSLTLFFILKLNMKGGEGFDIQILQHLSILLLVVSVFSLSRTTFNIWLRKSKLVSISIDFISSHSLEIYLVHLPILFFMRHNQMTNTLFIVPLLVTTLIASKYLKITAGQLLVKSGVNRA